MIDKIENGINIPPHERDTSVSKKEAMFLYNFISNMQIDTTLEVGLGFGYSAAYILEAHKGIHITIDPYQKNYNFLGVNNLNNLGYQNRHIFIEKRSDQALPTLVNEKKKIDLAFIDGGHKFDEIFIDFYYVDQLLSTEGYVIFHDAWMRSTQLVTSWIKTNKTNYKKVRSMTNMIVFQKIDSHDDREWYSFREFYTPSSIAKHTAFNVMHKNPYVQKVRAWMKNNS